MGRFSHDKLQESMERPVTFRTMLVAVSVAVLVSVLVSVFIVAGFMVLTNSTYWIQVSAESGFVSIRNDGNDFLTQCSIEYTFNGKRESTSSTEFSPDITKSLTIPQGAKDVSLKVSVCFRYSSKCELNDILTKPLPGPVKFCYSVFGYNHSPDIKIIDCKRAKV